jgi:hypothetical protein
MLHAPLPSVVCPPVADGALFLHTPDEVRVGLNPVAARAWELLVERS